MTNATTIYETIEQASRDLYIRAVQDIPRDVRAALRRSLDIEREQHNETAGHVLLTILDNIQTADQRHMLVCQDTGLAIFNVWIGAEASIRVPQLEAALQRGCERATNERPLRSNTVHPLTRKNTGTNTGQGVPIIHWHFIADSEDIILEMAPKGSGSENMSFLKMLPPSEGLQGIRRFVLHCIFEAGAQPCPPVIVGVGLGGTSDLAMTLAKQASTFRPIGSSNPDPDIAQLEKDLLGEINQIGIGPQGLGGATTALAVHIEWADTHISQNPVAVNLQCWRGERAAVVIRPDGQLRWR